MLRGRQRFLLWSARLALTLIVSSLLLEGTVRFLVGSEQARQWAVGRDLREPSHFGRYSADTLYWERQFLNLPPPQRIDNGTFDPEVGWTSRRFRPGDWSHAREGEVAGRRPVLLVGDSFADGIQSLDGRADFGTLFEASPLASDLVLLNYGVGGYGLDQVYLMMSRAVDRHLARRPVVVSSLLVSDDIDRCLLSFRSWPKPRLRLEGDELVRDLPQVPRVAEYFRSHSQQPLFLSCVLLRRALEPGRDSSGTPEEELEKQALGRAILDEMATALGQLGVPLVFMHFHGFDELEHPESLGWRETLMIQELDRLGVPWVCVRKAFLEHSRRTGRALGEYFFGWDDPGRGHYNALGNRVAFEVLLEGLREHLGIGAGGNLGRVWELEVVESPAQASPPVLAGVPALLEGQDYEAPCLLLDPRAGEDAGVLLRLGGGSARLTGRASVLGQGGGSEVVARLTLQRDDGPPLELQLTAGEAPRALELDLVGVGELRCSAQLLHSTARLTRVVVDRFELEPAAGAVPPTR